MPIKQRDVRPTPGPMKLALLVAVSAVSMLALPAIASAGTLNVPRDYATIADAVAAADNGDRIRVAPGWYCGATLDREVHLQGRGAVIVACDEPTVAGFNAGFFIGPDGSGSSIRGFEFDGAGIATDNLEPLAFAVFGRGANDVHVAWNYVRGTVQAITNTNGSGWVVRGNAIVELTVFPCDGLCAGGVGIVMQDRTSGRSSNNRVVANLVAGRAPDSLELFDMVGIEVLGQEGARVARNLVAIQGGDSNSEGIGIRLADQCCGTSESFGTVTDSTVLLNDGRASDVAVLVTPDADGGLGNLVGNKLKLNRGLVVLPE